MPGWARIQPFIGDRSYIYICGSFSLSLWVSLEKCLPYSWLGYEVDSQLCETLVGKEVVGVCVHIVDSHLIPLLSTACPSCFQPMLDVLEFPSTWLKPWNLPSSPGFEYFDWVPGSLTDSYRFATNQLCLNASYFQRHLLSHPWTFHWSKSPCLLLPLPTPTLRLV